MIQLGSVIIFKSGTNPYVYSREVGCVGEARRNILRVYQKTGVLPDGFSLWDDHNKKVIESPSEIDWAGLRD